MGAKVSTGETTPAEPPNLLSPGRKRASSVEGYRQVDVFSTFEHDADEDTNTIIYESAGKQGNSVGTVLRKSLRKCWSVMWRENWLFLILLGLIGAGLVMLIDFTTVKLVELQVMFSNLGGQSFWLSWFLWLIYSCFFALISCASVLFISPHAAGSGIPEMRCILSGIEIRRYLSIRTLIAKVVGFISAYVAGFSIGKEGPFVHISSMICRQMTRIPFFERIHKNDATYLEMLSAACASGVTLAFGSPVGGVLFSIEVTTSFYLISNLWRGFFVSACGALLLTAVDQSGLIALFLPSTSKESFHGYKTLEVFAFILLGLIGGVIGALFTKTIAGVFKLAGGHPWMVTKRGVVFRVLSICIIASATSFSFIRMRNELSGNNADNKEHTEPILTYLTTDKEIPDWGLLTALLCAKFFLTVFSVGFTGLPVGVYTPSFVTGAVYGRIFGEVVKLLFPTANIEPGAYAVIGAAAIASSVTHTVSTVVIVIELTREINLLLPVLIAVLVSTAVARLLSDSIYDVLIRQRQLPLMPRFDLYASYHQTAADVMQTDFATLKLGDKYSHLVHALERAPGQTYFPLIDENTVFLGAVRRSDIERVLTMNNIPFDISTPAPSLTEIMEEKFHKQVESSSSTSSSSASSDAIVIESQDTEGEVLESPKRKKTEESSSVNDTGEGVGMGLTEESTNSLLLAMGGNEEDSIQLERAAHLEAQVPFIFLSRHTGSYAGNVVEVDSTVMQIDSHTSVFKTHFLFTMLGLGHLFITNHGKLVGVVTRTRLIRYIAELNVNISQPQVRRWNKKEVEVQQ